MVAGMERTHRARHRVPLRDAVRDQRAAIPRQHTHTTHTETDTPTMTTTTPRRDHRMPLGERDEIAYDLAYMCADNAAGDDLRAAATTAVDRWRSAVKLAADARADHVTAAGDLRRMENSADDDMWRAFTSGKRPPIDAVVARLAKLADDKASAHDRYKRCERIEHRAASEMVRVIHDRPRDIIAWVASHRARNDDTAAMCGDVLPLPVLRTWYRLGILAHQITPLGLDLLPWEINGRLHRVPVEWPLSLDAKYRASLAWWWRRIHDGAYRITTNGRLVVTAAVVDDVPRVPATPSPTTVRRR
jgi:hypothetical protein